MKHGNLNLGERKTVFAWLPIKRWLPPNNSFPERRPYVKANGYWWLRRVVLTATMSGWIAYDDEQNNTAGCSRS